MENTGKIILLCPLLFGLETVQPSQLKCLTVTSLRDFCSPSKACQAGARCSAMSLSEVMNTLQEIMVPLNSYIDYGSKSFWRSGNKLHASGLLNCEKLLEKRKEKG